MMKKAFSLIELLVVIAIIAILLSIITPSLRIVKAKARSVACCSNISQLAMSLSIYEQENRSFPFCFNDASNLFENPSGGYLGNISRDKMGWWWINHIDIDLSKGSVAWCPSRKISDMSDKGNILCGNYGVNRSVCKDSPGPTGNIGDEFVGRPLSLSQIRNTTNTILLSDSGYSLISWKAATDLVLPRFDNSEREKYFYIPGMSINENLGLNTSKTPQAITGRHPKTKVNIAYSDGHASNIKSDDLKVDDITNISSLWKAR